ncbi:sigma-54 interaction domain-containing protein [Prosthecochloris sp. CIB 2401]|uniref:sigma-54 interaction domain-containing protein n=1 Tax=Prosthecochloris sp. CIB 2401 TaxID=1868325 RepID=UPI00080ABB0F|nr:sigma-54 dependent transcriptional regulator [Prosthecochloris sp. CIB 2401]ANT64899.1 Transcriptional regulatory protein ZraR [Prosthecochloris sp. CIB 2401]
MSTSLVIIADCSEATLEIPAGTTGGTIDVLRARDFDEALHYMHTNNIPLVLVSLKSSEQAAASFLRQCFSLPEPPRVMFCDTVTRAMSALKEILTLSPAAFGRMFSCAPPKSASHAPVKRSNVTEYKNLVGESFEMQKLKELLLKIAPTATTILLQGESGTGKEVIARAVHHYSSRSDQPFIPVDCAAINPSIIESELFGHARGAFTGAGQSTLGMIRAADKGTLFLDEIGELPLAMQVKLLRTLQERAVKPVGDTRLYPVDIRIIAATNKNLSEAVKSGAFRQDLYYRLNAITIFSPPLRERLGDIPLLAAFVLRKLTQEGYPTKQISDNALAVLSAYDWPGNIRELENVLRRAITLSSGSVITPESLDIESVPVTSTDPMNAIEVCPDTIRSYEREAIRKALEKTTGNRREAAELLGISEATLYRRLKMYGK